MEPNMYGDLKIRKKSEKISKKRKIIAYFLIQLRHNNIV